VKFVVDLEVSCEISGFVEFVLEKKQMLVNFLELENQVGSQL
jgi:hypothetical protein